MHSPRWAAALLFPLVSLEKLWARFPSSVCARAVPKVRCQQCCPDLHRVGTATVRPGSSQGMELLRLLPSCDVTLQLHMYMNICVHCLHDSTAIQKQYFGLLLPIAHKKRQVAQTAGWLPSDRPWAPWHAAEHPQTGHSAPGLSCWGLVSTFNSSFNKSEAEGSLWSLLVKDHNRAPPPETLFNYFLWLVPPVSVTITRFSSQPLGLSSCCFHLPFPQKPNIPHETFKNL